MSKSFFIIFLMVLVGAGWFFHERIKALCPVPLAYSIGRLDDEFELSEAEVRDAVAEAEAVWERELGQELFQYDPAATFTINFIFDERQERSDAEATALEALEAEETVVQEAAQEYEQLTSDIVTGREDFELNNTNYERDLAAYNAEVDRYNEDGGAPPRAFEALEAERARLERVAARLEEAAARLNALAEETNAVSARYNDQVALYNENVRAFNNTFAGGREFTQGDYQGDEIHVYTFQSDDELRLVLAHELGHAISLGHVEDRTAVMHYLLSEYNADATLTDADKEVFLARCDASLSWWEKFMLLFKPQTGEAR